MFEFFSPKRRVLVTILVLVGFAGILLFGLFSFSKPAEAGAARALGWVGAGALAIWGISEVSEGIQNAIASFDIIMINLLGGLAKLLGKLFTWVVGMLVQVAAYNNFLDATAVVTGWVIVRDLANMFFILILLVISIATILRVEAYSYKKLLPKLLLMAVLINFSKTICGIIIDFAQVIMLTFVNAFQAAAGANFFQALGINQMFSFETLANEAGAADQQWDLVGTAFLALIVVLIATITVGVLMVVLVARIVILWTLIVLSPLAYLLASFPQGQQYAKQWWDEFSKYVISGPILAFFIWLALIVAGGGTANTEIGVDSTALDAANGLGDIGKYNNLSSLVVGVTMLLVGLMFTQKLGIIGSGAAGAALSGLRRAGTAPFRTAWRGAKGGVGLAWRGTKGAAKFGAGQVSELTYAKTGVALPFSERRKEARAKRRKNISAMREAEGMAKTAERMAGGRAFLASVIDPRAASKMSRWEMAKATLGGKEAQGKVRRAADSLAGAAASEMRSVDPLQAERLKQRTEAAIGERQAAGQIAERDGLELKVRRGEADVFGLERGIQGIAKSRERQGMSDAALRKDLANERAEMQVAEEEKKTPMTPEERQQRYQELYNQNLSDIDVDKERKGLEKFFKEKGGVSAAQKLEGQWILEKGKLEDKLKIDASNLEKVKLRLENPDAARDAARSDRDDAEKSISRLSNEKKNNQLELNKLIEKASAPGGFLTPAERDKKFDLETRQKEIDVDIKQDQQVIQNIDVELKSIEQAAGAEKVKGAQEFFGKSYKQQLEQAVKSAESTLEKSLSQKMAELIKEKDFNNYDKLGEVWKKQGPEAAIAEFERIKAAKAAKVQTS
ncbi:MAG: hypothetical protein WC445_02660 [Patescibacteria group bacterium]